MNKNTVIISLISILVTFLLLFGVYKLIDQPVVTYFPQLKQLKADDHVKWSPVKKNILVEYSDFQCPSCKGAHDFLKTIEASGSADFDITKKVTFVFKYFPLYQIHDNANNAAYAAEAAGNQGKFWEMGELLFASQQSWASSSDPLKEYFLSYAKELKLDLTKFTKDIYSNEVVNRVTRDLNEAQQMGVDSTPTFFLNGQKVDVNSYEEFKTKLKNL